MSPRNLAIFVGPAVLDFVLFVVLFAVCYGAGERGLTLGQCAWLGGIFQLAYMAASLLVGLALSRRNARPLLLASTVACGALAAACLLLVAFWPLLVALAALGVCAAGFFNSFQTYMRGEAPPGGLAHATGVYTLAWSFGAGLGFLLSGTMYRLGPAALALVVLAGVGTVLAFLLRHRPRAASERSADEHEEPGPPGSRAVDPRYVWMAWTGIFTVMFAQRPLQTFYPALCAREGVSPALASLPLFAQMAVQAFGGLAMARWRGLLYRRTPFVLIQGLAGLGLLALWRCPAYAATAAGLVALGLWTGFAYFCAVYYAGNSGARSRNIGVNEFLVGLGAFAGLQVVEQVMRAAGDDAAMYAVCGASLLAAVAVQWAMVTWRWPGGGQG